MFKANMTLDNAIPEVDPRYPTLRVDYPDTEAIEQRIKNRLAQAPSRLELLAHNPELFLAALEEEDVQDFMTRLNKSS